MNITYKMNQFMDNKKNDDLNDDLNDDDPMCNCNLYWSARQIMLILPNNILLKNPLVLFILMFVFPIFIFVIILRPIISFIMGIEYACIFTFDYCYSFLI